MSLLEKIQKAKAEKALLGERPNHQKITEADISLRGTGLTKRVIERSGKAYAKEAEKSLKADHSDLVSEVEEKFHEGINATIEEMRRQNLHADVQYDESQIAAIAGISHNKVACLIGPAGTGKTTVTKKIVSVLAKKVKTVRITDASFITVAIDAEGTKARMLQSAAIAKGYLQPEKEEDMPGIAFAAYTGRATQQIKRALPEEWHKNCSTMHSLLGYAPVFEEIEDVDKMTGQEYMKTVIRFRPSFDKTMKLPYTIYVLDEASMIPIPLFNELIDAIHETSRILLIGDIHQLPPVYGKSVLGYAMRKWPVFELTTIHRQNAGNAIITNAHRTLHGKMLENAGNFHLIGNDPKQPSPAGSGELQTYFLSTIKKLSQLDHPKGGKCFDPYTDAIIVPQNKGPVGQDILNEHLVTMFNPETKENGVIVNKRIAIHTGTNHVYFAVRDKVMITSNINTVDPPITNGMIGIVETININERYDMKRAQVDFSDNEEDDEEEFSLDIGNMEFALNSALGAENDKEKKKDDETNDQRQSSHVLTIKFENGQSYTCSTAGDYRRVAHGYAATCHKSQGGEYPNIIILCHSVNAVMLTQEWLYTAITRARNNVYIVCNKRGLEQALKTQKIKGYTLKDKIKSYIIETKSDDDMGFDTNKYPILWEPREVN